MVKILCVDGLDYNRAKQLGLSMKYQKPIKIPKECYYAAPDSPYPPHPHTWLVWSSMFSGKAQSIFPIIDKKPAWRLAARKILNKLGITRVRKSKIKYGLNPAFEDLNTVLNTNSFYWNIPTISPEWIAKTPNGDLPRLYKFLEREYQTFRQLAWSENDSFDIYAIYTRCLDVYGHLKEADILHARYTQIFDLANEISFNERVILISDHGTELGPMHTDYAYIGSNYPISKINNILDVRPYLEGIIK